MLRRDIELQIAELFGEKQILVARLKWVVETIEKLQQELEQLETEN